MIIEMTALDKSNYYKPLFYYNSARNAFKDILLKHLEIEEITILLPGYIGLSAKEGSGIFDPVVETGARYKFYELDRNLCIKVDSLRKLLDSVTGRAVVLLVHYFGYPDPNISTITTICRQYNSIVIEDEAHALYSDFIDHSCGQYGDYAIYSIHKMLPYQYGGALKVLINHDIQFSPEYSEDPFHIFNYDFYGISMRRKRNAKLWTDLLSGDSSFQILRPYSGNVTPQTFPVIIKNFDRNSLYFRLNDAGFGDVSLYHTMINPIIDGNFDDSKWVSKHITNLPVHQDVSEAKIEMMYQEIKKIVN